ncbi:MAG: sialate O-acetylesterase, partial [Bacteroidota bacterium]
MRNAIQCLEGKRYIYVAFLVAVSFSQLSAKIRLPEIVDSNMVLQRGTTVNIWGWSDKSSKVKLTASWFDETFEAKPNEQGLWRFQVETTNSKAPQTITLSDTDSEVRLENILFGEVWLCSGQSNMEMPLTGFRGEPTMLGMQAIVNSSNPNIRLFTIERSHSPTPLDTLIKCRNWQKANPENVSEFSAIAYFFGSQLHEFLDIPVGLIHSSWGGSTIQAWMADDLISQYEKYRVDTMELTTKEKIRSTPTLLYNAMIHP